MSVRDARRSGFELSVTPRLVWGGREIRGAARLAVLVTPLAAIWLAGCVQAHLLDGGPGDSGVGDAGVRDAATRDAGDGGRTDGGTTDGGRACEAASGDGGSGFGSGGGGASEGCVLSSPRFDAHARVTHDPSLIPDPPFTVEAWVWFDQLWARDQTVLVKWLDADGGIQLHATTSALECLVSDGTSPSVAQLPMALASDLGLVARSWVHLACTLDASGELVLWVGGQRTGSAAGAAFSDPAAGLGIGTYDRRFSWGYPFVGLIDDVRVSRTVRYNADFATQTVLSVDGDTVALWGFDECDGSMALNEVDNFTFAATLECGAGFSIRDAAPPGGLELRSSCACGCGAGLDCLGDACGTWFAAPSDRDAELTALAEGRGSTLTFESGAWANGDVACAGLGRGPCLAVVDFGGVFYHCCAEPGASRAVICAPP